MKKAILIISVALFICLIVSQSTEADWIKGRDIWGRIKMTSGRKIALIDTSIAKNETMIIALGETVSFQDNGSDDEDAYEDSTNDPDDDMPLRLVLPGNKTYTEVGPKTEEIKIFDFPEIVDEEHPDPCPKFDEGPLTVTANIIVLNVNQTNNLWWFNDEDLCEHEYFVHVTLIALGATTGTFKWEVIEGDDKVTLNNDGDDSDTIIATDDNTVTVKSTAPSVSYNDVKIRFTYNNIFVQNWGITVKAPHGLHHVNDDDDSYGSGFQSRIYYEIKDQFNITLPYRVPWNEDIDGDCNYSDAGTVSADAISDWTIANGKSEDENWTWGEECGWLVFPNNAYDSVGRPNPPGWVPTPMNPQEPLTNYRIDHSLEGAWYVGSTIIGKGVQVKTLRWQIYIDHARHE